MSEGGRERAREGVYACAGRQASSRAGVTE